MIHGRDIELWKYYCNFSKYSSYRLLSMNSWFPLTKYRSLCDWSACHMMRVLSAWCACYLHDAGAILPALLPITAHTTTVNWLCELYANKSVATNKSVPSKVLARNTKTFAGTDLFAGTGTLGYGPQNKLFYALQLGEWKGRQVSACWVKTTHNVTSVPAEWR